ncbi:MAG: NAD(P)H-hydrate dehydratase [Methylophilaceae bacterium]
MTALFTTSQIRAIESRHAQEGLMEKAGHAAATLARDILVDGDHAVLVLAGPGNNGGDAFVAARHLKQWWYKVTVVFTGNRENLPKDAADAYAAWISAGGTVVEDIPESSNWHLVIDGLFGIGLQRELDDRYSHLIGRVNALALPVLSLDIPSGLCADTGRIFGVAIHARYTLTFLGLKPGLFTLNGPDYAGEVHLSNLGVDIESGSITLLDQTPALPEPRLKNSHKGSNGSVGVIGGARFMVGAAILAARAALLLGSGRVYCGLLTPDAPSVDISHPELMLRDAESILELPQLSILLIGPGMGLAGDAESLLARALKLSLPLLLDADALNLISQKPLLKTLLLERQPQSTVITPHPGEAASLLGCSNAQIQSDRLGSASKLTKEFNAMTVLKGCGTVIALPDGRTFINVSGNPGLSSAGMGDTLAGIIGGIFAQGLSLEEATLLGVYLHGAAADALVSQHIGPNGLTASEVALESRRLLNQWVYADALLDE